MNSYKDLEDAIILRLAPLLSDDVEIEAMPETDADYEEPFAKPRVSISYQHSEYADTITRGLPNMLTTDLMAQDEFAEVHIVLRSRVIRTDTEIKGIYWLHRKVVELLYGFQPDVWDRLFPKTFDYLGHKNGTWIYDLILVCKRTVVQQYTDDHEVVYPTLEDVNFNFNNRVDGIIEFDLLLSENNNSLDTEDGRGLNVTD